MPPKIALLGPIPSDHITTATGQVIEKYGCVTHPAIALSRLLRDSGSVIPVCHVRKSDEQPIRELLSQYPGIDLSGIYSHHDQGDVIRLRFIDQNNRLEKQTAFMPPILPEDVAFCIDADAWVCVPITDYEVPLETLQYIKANGKGIVIFDAHGPTTTATASGDRLRQFWIDRDLWLPSIDVLKMNIEEAGCCWFKKEYTLDELAGDHGEMTLEDLAVFARHCLSKGVKAVYITLDSRGVMAYSIQNGAFHAEMVPSVKVDFVIDTTGCGDSFAGGLAYGYQQFPDGVVEAAQYGNILGALRTQGTTFDVFKDKAETEEIRKNSYGG